MVRSIKHLKKGHPGTTNSEQKDNKPITDCNFVKVTVCLRNKASNTFLAMTSLSSGSRAGMCTASRIIPKNWMEVEGPQVFFWSQGNPNVVTHSDERVQIMSTFIKRMCQ